MNLTLDLDTHTYRADGIVVPGVTNVMEDVGIIDYSAVPWDIRENALRRGTAVHLACQFDDENDLRPCGKELAGYVAAWRKFRAVTGFTPTLIEHKGFQEQYRYAGTLDRVGHFKNGEEWVLDIKTTEAPWWTRIQVAAYAAFFANPATYRRMGVALQADGDYKTHSYPRKNWRRDFNVFLNALAIHNEKQEKKAV